MNGTPELSYPIFPPSNGPCAPSSFPSFPSQVLPSLRFPRMSSDFLSDVVAHSSLFADSPSATHLLVEALAYKSLSRLRQVRWEDAYGIFFNGGFGSCLH